MNQACFPTAAALREGRPTFRIDLDLARISWIVAALAGAVILLGIGREVVIHHIGDDTVLRDLRHFAFDTERCLPAWFSSTLMTVCAALLFLCGRIAKRDDAEGDGPWLVLSLLFIAMSIDETVSVHELAIEPLRNAFSLSGVFYFAWVIPGTIGMTVLGFYFLPFLLRLPRPAAIGFAAAGVIYVSGALGMEFVGGAMASAYGQGSGVYKVAAVIEESLEIAGLTFFFVSLLRHISTHAAGLALGVAGARQRRSARTGSVSPA